MRISREARILLALVAVAAAAWVWINYFSQEGGVLIMPAVPTTSLARATPPASVPNNALSAETPADASTSDDLTAQPSPFGTVPVPTEEDDSARPDAAAPSGDALADSGAQANDTSAASTETADTTAPTSQAGVTILPPANSEAESVAANAAGADTIMVDSSVSASGAADGLAANSVNPSTTGGEATSNPGNVTADGVAQPNLGSLATSSSQESAATPPTVASDGSGARESETSSSSTSNPATTRAFRDFDTDAGGNLNDVEFRVVFADADLFGQFDIDASGDINEDEFNAMNANMISGGQTVDGDTIAFSDFDADANGTIDENEFNAGMEMSGGAMSGAFSDFDTDASGDISEEEFNTLNSSMMSGGQAVVGTDTGMSTVAFGDLDADASGTVDEDEFNAGMGTLGDTFTGTFGDFDTDASSDINEDEFNAMNSSMTDVSNSATTGGDSTVVGANARAFSDFDTDASGGVDENEFSVSLFGVFDADASGSVDENEFNTNRSVFGNAFGNVEAEGTGAEGVAAEGADTSQADAAEPLAEVASPEPLTAREVEVAELPFLVTEPPALDILEESAAVPDLNLARPNGGLRATVNPFSPILLAPPPEGSQSQALPNAPAVSSESGLAPPSTPSGIVDVPIPDAPTAATATAVATAPQTPTQVTAPAPQLLTPRAGVTASLPRPLPGGTLPATPELLRTTRSPPALTAETEPTEVAPAVDNFAAVAALRVPGGAATSPDFADAAPPALNLQTEPAEAEPLQLASAPGRGPAAGNPIAAGTSSLTRYLRDGNYRFTGYVISAVGVGVFRSNESAAPVVVTLGQVIPGTEIVLTSLEGEQAELTLGGEKQILILNPGG